LFENRLVLLLGAARIPRPLGGGDEWPHNNVGERSSLLSNKVYPDASPNTSPRYSEGTAPQEYFLFDKSNKGACREDRTRLILLARKTFCSRRPTAYRQSQEQKVKRVNKLGF